MSTPATYTPQEGSAPWKVLQFLQANPDEQLDADLISAKCDCSRASVHTLMRPAVEAQLLKREEDRGSGELVYSLGPAGAASALQEEPTSAFHAWLERKGQDSAEGLTARRKGSKSATTPAPAAEPAVPTGARVKRGKPYWVDTSKVTIDKDVPMSGRGRPVDWVPLFDKLDIGHSFRQPREARSSLSTAMKAYRQATGKVLTSEQDADGIRVWRAS